METFTLILSLVGSAILVLGFVPQARLMYTLKHTYGISKMTWIQNYIGRIAFSAYIAFTASTWAVVPLIFGQLLVGMMSIPVIYYTLRNEKTKGQYTKEHFDKKLFAIRITLTAFLAVAAIVIILMTEAIDVIHIPHGHETWSKIMNLVLSIVGTGIVSTAFIPQTFKTIRSRKTSSTSLLLTIMFAIGNTLIVLAFVVRAATANDLLSQMQYIGTIIIASSGVIAMIFIIIIKIANIRAGIDTMRAVKKTPQ